MTSQEVAVAPAANEMSLASESRRGRLVAFWSAKGAPGRTTCAVNVAWELAMLAADVALLDFDSYGATVAVALDLDTSPDVTSLSARAAAGDLTPVDLRQRLARPLPNLGLAAGPGGPDLWPLLRSDGVRALLDICRQEFDFVICDLASCIEDDAELLLSRSPWRRNQAAICVLEDADIIYMPVACDPVSVHSAILSHATLAAIPGDPSSRALALLNRVDTRKRGHDVEVELVDTLGLMTEAVFPEDAASCREALWAGRPLADVAPQGPLRLRVADLAARLIAGSAHPEQAGHRHQ